MKRWYGRVFIWGGGGTVLKKSTPYEYPPSLSQSLHSSIFFQLHGPFNLRNVILIYSIFNGSWLILLITLFKQHLLFFNILLTNTHILFYCRVGIMIISYINYVIWYGGRGIPKRWQGGGLFDFCHAFIFLLVQTQSTKLIGTLQIHCTSNCQIVMSPLIFIYFYYVFFFIFTFLIKVRQQHCLNDDTLILHIVIFHSSVLMFWMKDHHPIKKS